MAIGDFISGPMVNADQLALAEEMARNLPGDVYIDQRGEATHYTVMATPLDRNAPPQTSTLAERTRDRGMKLITSTRPVEGERVLINRCLPGGRRERLVGYVTEVRTGLRAEDLEGPRRYFSEFQVTESFA